MALEVTADVRPEKKPEPKKRVPFYEPGSTKIVMGHSHYLRLKERVEGKMMKLPGKVEWHNYKLTRENNND
jgi:hypothetical protein